MKIVLLLLAVLAAMSAPAAERRPNFLIVLADNLGRDWFGCYGGDGGHTPNIDRLAAGGVRFPHCYVTPLCSTTRVQFLTGRYGFSTGWHTHHDAAFYGGGGFDWRRETTWARVLRDAGYATCVTGKWQINDLYDQRDALRQHGFDEHLVWSGALVGEGLAEQRWMASIAPGGVREIESRYWDPIIFRNGEHAVLPGKFGPDVYLGYLLDFIARNRERPFVAYYSCPFTHIPTVPTVLVPDKAASEREQFIGMVRSMDAQMGRLVEELERLGLRDDTIIVFTTDNGTPAKLSNTVGGQPAKGGLGTLSENGLDVPLIVNCPTRVSAGRVSRALVDCSDIFPTLLELAGVPVPAGLKIDGRSFAPELGAKREGWQPREWIFAQYAGERVVRDERHKLYASGKFFDVEADPLEQRDLGGGASEARRKLQRVLDGLPPDVDVGFAFRSSSAFKLQGTKVKSQRKK